MPHRQLLEAGSAYAMPQKDGRMGVCRVLRRRTEDEIKFWHGDGMLVATCDWIGETVPDVGLADLRSILRLTHHAWTGRLELTWVEEKVPADFVLIGIIPSTPKEKRMECQSHGSWNSIRIQPLMQWRWAHDREALLAEEAAADQAAREQEQLAERERLAKLTLDQLVKRCFFPDWRDYPSKKAKRASRKIMRETARELLELGEDANKREKKAILKKCIERFNELHETLDHFIETDEAEAIVCEFDTLAYVCGVKDKDLADQWRDW